MKKRILCALLALIMLVGLVPLSASAAGLSVSEDAITVLKQLQIYSTECKQCGTEWRNGYGTICTRRGEHNAHTDTFNEGDANKALRAKLKEIDAAVNASGLSLTQAQHDALVVFSYDVGTSWLSGSGVLKSAVANKLTGNAFLNAIGQSAAYGSDTTDKITGSARRMIEANMYLNGNYSNIAPSNYGYVTFNANGGNMAEGTNGTYTQYFNTALWAEPAVTPTKKDNIFLGWYDGDVWVPYLSPYQVGRTLTAKWQPANATYVDALAVNHSMPAEQLASLAIFAAPSANAAITGTVTGAVRVDRDFIDANGARWSRLSGNKGWILRDAGTGASQFEIDVTVTVTNATLNRRVNASVTSGTNGSYVKGDQLRIVMTEMGSGYLWGQVADENGNLLGWVALMYTNWSEVKDNPAASNTNKDSNVIAEAVINCAGYLNVRSEAGTDNAIVGALADGDHVEIYELKFVNGHQWGRTSDGWILLTYAKVTMLDEDMNFSNTEDVLAYTFTGTLKNATIAHKDVSHNSDTVGKELAAGTLVAMSMVKNDDDGKIWGYNGTGWILLDNVKMDVAKYVVITDSVTVRATASSAAAGVEKVVKGVELDISEIAVVDATIWGKTEKYGGWVNLASKFVQRSNAPIIENVDAIKETGLIATVINTDAVKVRSTGATYGDILGSLSRGTTVRVWPDEGDGWYKLDTNQNGVYDYEGDGWVSAKYLDVYYGTIGGDEEEGSSNGTTGNGTTGTAAVETGLGIVANTYTGVNVRTGAGTGYAATGKILTGTVVEILEVTHTATSKWGRTDKGWICMDYVTMVSNYPIGDAATENTPDPNAGQNVGGSTTETTGNTTVSSTPAVYTGSVSGADVKLYKTADEDAATIRDMAAGENVTIHELRKVTTKKTVEQGTVVDGNATTETTTTVTNTTTWARVNGGWIKDPAENLALNPLDETVYTVVNSSDVDVRDAAGSNYAVTEIEKGTQVSVTKLQIVGDKVWGFVEDVGTSGGWVRLDELSQGAITVKEESSNNNTNNNTNTGNGTNNIVFGNGSNMGGYVNNTSGYRYTGKIINTNTVNVRTYPSANNATSPVTVQLKAGASVVIYETTIAENMAWGRCDAGWIYLYYVDLVPVVSGAVDARVVYNENTPIWTDTTCTSVAGTYARMSVIDIYEIVGDMARTDKGWVRTTDLLN